MTTDTFDIPIDPRDRRAAGLYDAMITRYRNLPIEQSVPMTAIRLYTIRVGFDVFLRQLLAKHGVARVGERCRNELTVRQEFIARMVADYPPDSAQDAEDAIQEMAEDLAVADSPEPAMRLLKFLDRMRTREIARKARPAVQQVH